MKKESTSAVLLKEFKKVREEISAFRDDMKDQMRSLYTGLADTRADVKALQGDVKSLQMIVMGRGEDILQLKKSMGLLAHDVGEPRQEVAVLKQDVARFDDHEGRIFKLERR